VHLGFVYTATGCNLAWLSSAPCSASAMSSRNARAFLLTCLFIQCILWSRSRYAQLPYDYQLHHSRSPSFYKRSTPSTFTLDHSQVRSRSVSHFRIELLNTTPVPASRISGAIGVAMYPCPTRMSSLRHSLVYSIPTNILLLRSQHPPARILCPPSMALLSLLYPRHICIRLFHTQSRHYFSVPWP